MKIQINSLEALERLIGGDTDLEIEVRNSVVQDFTKKHLKALATSEVVSLQNKACIQEIKDEFFVTVKERWNTIVKFNPTIVDKLKRDLIYSAERNLRKTVSDALKEIDYKTKITNQINHACDYIVSELTDKVLENRLNKLVDERLKQKLNIS